jgi:hypothetical protein
VVRKNNTSAMFQSAVARPTGPTKLHYVRTSTREGMQRIDPDRHAVFAFRLRAGTIERMRVPTV